VLSFALGVACSTEGVPPCTGVDWIGRLDEPQLTGPPTFSAQQIAAGDPLRIAVPVDVNTRSVRVIIEAINGSVPGSNGSAETGGGEIVDVGVDNTDLAPGVYLAMTLILRGDETLLPVASYSTNDPQMPYVLSISTVPEESDKCLTEIAAPTFTVVTDDSAVR
jgi:hypothetical protein